MSTIFKKILFSCVALFAVASNANALTSNGSDGAFIANGEITLNVTDGQVFNFTTIDINSGGILNLIGSSPSSSFSMLASGDINIAGLLNIYTNTIFETSGHFNISGKVNSFNQSSVTISNGAVNSNFESVNKLNPVNLDLKSGIKACMLGDCGNLEIRAGGTLTLSPHDSYPLPSASYPVPYSSGLITLKPNLERIVTIDITNSITQSFPTSPTLTPSLVPEPSSYALLLSGIALITLARRKTSN